MFPWIAALARKTTGGERKVIAGCSSIVLILAGIAGLIFTITAKARPETSGARIILFLISLGVIGLGVIIIVVWKIIRKYY